MENRFRVKFKLWLEDPSGEPLISWSKYLLLKEVEKTGSIKRAAQKLGIPYKKAHIYLKLLEERTGSKLLLRKRGKGTFLTEEGKKLLSLYGEILEDLNRVAKKWEERLKKGGNP